MLVQPSLSPRRWRWLAVVPLLACLSCGGGGAKLNPVQGTVFYKDKPVGGVLLTFHPVKGDDAANAQRPVGVSKDDGSFTLTTGNETGAPPGEYTVTAILSEEIPVKGKKGVISTAMPETQDRFQGAYANVANSKVKITIKAGSNPIEVKLP